MDDITQKLKKMMKSKKNQKIIHKQSNAKLASIFVDDLSQDFCRFRLKEHLFALSIFQIID
jgi:hypothetical protein